MLNNDYTFVGICSPESAIIAWYTNKVVIEESYQTVWRSVSTEIRVPAVIRLKKYVKILYEHLTYVSYSKRNVHLRDRYLCQYCGIKPETRRLTIDHIIPETKGGLTTWSNTVSCCATCNSIKDNRTPQEADMKLIRIPGKPKGFSEIIRIRLGELHDLWKKYLM